MTFGGFRAPSLYGQEAMHKHRQVAATMNTGGDCALRDLIASFALIFDCSDMLDGAVSADELAAIKAASREDRDRVRLHTTLSVCHPLSALQL